MDWFVSDPRNGSSPRAAWSRASLPIITLMAPAGKTTQPTVRKPAGIHRQAARKVGCCHIKYFLLFRLYLPILQAKAATSGGPSSVSLKTRNRLAQYELTAKNGTQILRSKARSQFDVSCFLGNATLLPTNKPLFLADCSPTGSPQAYFRQA